MADEVKAEGAEAVAPKLSFVQKLFRPPLVIVLALVIGVGAAFGVMKFMGPKASDPGQAAAGAAEGGGGEGGEGGGHGTAETKKIDEAAHGAPAKVHGEEAPKDAHGGSSATVAENTYKLEPFVVNIMEKNSIHYLKLTFEVETTSPRVIEEIKEKNALLRDSILYIVSDMTMREIVTMGGKTLLKEEIITHFNRQLTSGKIIRLFFTDFTIQ